MYYLLNKDVYFRSYGDKGYITSTGLFQDKTVDAVGAVFLEALDRIPRHISALSCTIAAQFTDVDEQTIENDAAEFYNAFAEDGFLVCGKTEKEALGNLKGFTYNVVEPQTMKKNFTPDHSRVEADSQEHLDAFFLHNPQLTSFQIELTSRCNERCVHCYIPHEFKDTDLDPVVFYKVLRELKEMGTWHVTLSGGEPMLHPHFKDFLASAKAEDMYVSVLSNLTLLDDEVVDIMKLDNVASVQVSLYSMDPETHDAITQQPGSFVKTLSAIEKLVANGIPVQISCPTMKENKNDFGAVMRWAHDHKIRAITDYAIMAEYNHDTTNLSHRLTPEECGDVICDILEDDPDYQEQILSSDFEERAREFFEDMDSPLCGVGISTLCMASNGEVYPCPGWQTYHCGNVKLESLEDIWKHSKKLAQLRALRRRDLKPCDTCTKREFCSPCMVRNANESPTGDPMEVAPYFCEVAQVNKNIVMSWREEHLAPRQCVGGTTTSPT